MKNAKRSDTGQYRLQLKNESGFDTATVNVKVLDRPGPPENLRAEEFGGDALTLYWNPPKDNGGVDIANYIVEKKEARSSTWSKAILQKSNMVFYRIKYYVTFSVSALGEQLCYYAVPQGAKPRRRKRI